MKFGLLIVLLTIVAVGAYAPPTATCPYCCQLGKDSVWAGKNAANMVKYKAKKNCNFVGGKYSRCCKKKAHCCPKGVKKQNYACCDSLVKKEAVCDAKTNAKKPKCISKKQQKQAKQAKQAKKNKKNAKAAKKNKKNAAAAKGKGKQGAAAAKAKKAAAAAAAKAKKAAAAAGGSCAAPSMAHLVGGKAVMCGSGHPHCPANTHCHAGAKAKAAVCCSGAAAKCDHSNCGNCVADSGCYWDGNVCLDHCATDHAKTCFNKCTCANNNWQNPSLNVKNGNINNFWGPGNNNNNAVYLPEYAVPGSCWRRCGSTGMSNGGGAWGNGWGFGWRQFGFGGGAGGWGYGMPFGGAGGYGFAPPPPPRGQQQPNACSCDSACAGRGDCCFDKCQLCD